jgi:hypothetical protein
MKRYFLRDVTRREKEKRKPRIMVNTEGKDAKQAGLSPISFFDILQQSPNKKSTGLPRHQTAYHEFPLHEDVRFTLGATNSPGDIIITFSTKQDKIIIQEEPGEYAAEEHALDNILPNFGIINGATLSFFTVLPQKAKVPVKEKRPPSKSKTVIHRK